MGQILLVLQIVGRMSLTRYTAYITKAISGNSDVWIKLTALVDFALVAMAQVLKKLRWREV